MPYKCSFCGSTHETEQICPRIPSNSLPATSFAIADVSSQPHYTQHEIQVIEFCERNKLGWCASNVVKYVCRENKKNGLEDLQKALIYLASLIEYKRTGKFTTPERLEVKIALKMQGSTHDPSVGT